MTLLASAIPASSFASMPLLAFTENTFVAALVFSAIGFALFGLAFLLIVKVSPFSIRKEIEEDQNISLGIIIGAVIIGISMIISAAIQG
jgi:putative membrane protein